ncbi:MAG: dihydrofolate reductase [Clostridia bacterium]|nr:dihydrofolate reductase [Clostridia bacterium]
MEMIVAVDMNWAIGKNNDLLFHIPEDMKFFRQKTIGKNVVCGKKTLLSFPGSKPLPDRRHFVLTHSDLEESEDLVKVSSLEDLFEKTKDIPSEEVLVIGGESVYRQLLSKCEKVYVTKIFATDPEADVFFPNLDEDKAFYLAEEGDRTVSKNGLEFSFCCYHKK